jgi:hypothetical protein
MKYVRVFGGQQVNKMGYLIVAGLLMCRENIHVRICEGGFFRVWDIFSRGRSRIYTVTVFTYRYKKGNSNVFINCLIV